MATEELSALLNTKQVQLSKRISAIEADFHKGRSQDFAEQASTQRRSSRHSYVESREGQRIVSPLPFPERQGLDRNS